MSRNSSVCAAVLLAVIAPACTTSSRISVPPSQADPNATTSQAVSSTSSTIPPAQLGFTFLQVDRDDDEALIDITFPVIHHPVDTVAPPVNDRIIATVDQLVTDFTAAVTTAPPSESRSTFTLEAAPELLNDDVFSASGIAFEFVRGANPSTSRVAWIFSVKTGSLVSPAELFRGGRLDRLAEASREHLIADVLGGAAALTVPDGLLPTRENFDAVWLTATGVGVGFDQFQVADGDAGSPAILIPYAELLDAFDMTGILSPLQDGPTLPES